MGNTIGQKIEEEYIRIRQQNDEIRKKRQSEIYSKIPRIREIDDKLFSARTSMIKSLFSKNYESAEDEIISLLNEKEKLLTENGYPSDYTEPIYNCRECMDTGFIMTTPCTCYKQKKTEHLRDYANITESMKKCTFDSFDFSLYDKGSGISPFDYAVSAYTQCKNFVEKQEYKTGKNMILYGGTGLGKTFLCGCIASALIENGVPAVYTTAYALTNQMEEQKFKGIDNSEITDIYYNMPVLIIDDLGTEFFSSFTSSFIFDLLNSRLGNEKSTVISTNLSMDEIKEHYGPRIQSRILGEYELLKLAGKDIRTKKLLND